MGLLSSIGTAASVAADVSSGVFSLGKGVLSAGLSVGKGVIGLVSKVSKSLIGKFVIGAGAVGVLSSIKPSGSDESLLSKLGSGFKSFLGSITSSVTSKASDAALGVAATATQVGTSVSKAAKEMETSEPAVGLRDAVITNAPLSFEGADNNPGTGAEAQAEDVPQADGEEPELHPNEGEPELA